MLGFLGFCAGGPLHCRGHSVPHTNAHLRSTKSPHPTARCTSPTATVVTDAQHLCDAHLCRRRASAWTPDLAAWPWPRHHRSHQRTPGAHGVCHPRPPAVTLQPQLLSSPRLLCTHSLRPAWGRPPCPLPSLQAPAHPRLPPASPHTQSACCRGVTDGPPPSLLVPPARPHAASSRKPPTFSTLERPKQSSSAPPLPGGPPAPVSG